MSGDYEALERRYLRLLHCYPAEFRRARGSELLDTVMQAAAPGQRWPARREWWALVLGGLRARTGANQARSRSEVWLGAVRLAVLFLLAHAGALAVVTAVGTVDAALTGWLPSSGQLASLAVPVLVGAAILAVAAGRPAAALGPIVTAAVIQHLLSTHLWMRASTSTHWMPVRAPHWGLDQQVWQLPLAAVLLVPLLWRRPTTSRRPWRWLLAVPVAALVLPGEQYAGPLSWWRLPLLLVALGWCLIDARVPVAAAAPLLGYTLPEAVLEWAGPSFQFAWPDQLPGLPSAGMPVSLPLVAELIAVSILLTAGTLRANHQLRA